MLSDKYSSDSDSSEDWNAELGPPTLPGGLSAYHVVEVRQPKTHMRDVIAVEIAELKRIDDITRKDQVKRKVILKNCECQTNISGPIVASQTFTVGNSDKVLLPSSSTNKLYSYFRDKYYLVEKDWPTSPHSKNKKDQACQTTFTGNVFHVKKVELKSGNEKEQPNELRFEREESSNELYVIVP